MARLGLYAEAAAASLNGEMTAPEYVYRQRRRVEWLTRAAGG